MLAVPPTATVIHVKLSLTTADLRQTMENLDNLKCKKQNTHHWKKTNPLKKSKQIDSDMGHSC